MERGKKQVEKAEKNNFVIDVEGCVTVVTGGSSGIGLSIVKAFLQSRALVANWDLNKSKPIEELETEYPGKITTFVTDITDIKQIENATEQTLNRYGRVDILINNAGIIYKSAIEELEMDLWDRIYDINVKGTVLTTKYLTPFLKRSGRGRIINLSSMTSAIGLETYSPYSSTKAAVSNLTKVWALELAPYGVTVNAICPGWVDTPMKTGLIKRIAALHGLTEEKAQEEILNYVPQHRFISPDEIAFCALFLASPLAQAISGTDIFIDTGLTHSFKPGFHMIHHK